MDQWICIFFICWRRDMEKVLYYSPPVTSELTKIDVPLMLTCTPVLVQAVKQTIKLSLIWDTMTLVWCYYNEVRMYNSKLSYSSVA